jgi:hypothetical protein
MGVSKGTRATSTVREGPLLNGYVCRELSEREVKICDIMDWARILEKLKLSILDNHVNKHLNLSFEVL